MKAGAHEKEREREQMYFCVIFRCCLNFKFSCAHDFLFFFQIRNQTNCFGMQMKLCLVVVVLVSIIIQILTLQLNQHHCQKNPSVTSICSDVMMALMVCFV